MTDARKRRQQGPRNQVTIIGGTGNVYSQQQNALGYNLSVKGIGDVAIDGLRLEPGSDVSQGGLAKDFLLIYLLSSVSFATISLSVLAVGLQSCNGMFVYVCLF